MDYKMEKLETLAKEEDLKKGVFKEIKHPTTGNRFIKVKFGDGVAFYKECGELFLLKHYASHDISLRLDDKTDIDLGTKCWGLCALLVADWVYCGLKSSSPVVSCKYRAKEEDHNGLYKCNCFVLSNIIGQA